MKKMLKAGASASFFGFPVCRLLSRYFFDRR